MTRKRIMWLTFLAILVWIVGGYFVGNDTAIIVREVLSLICLAIIILLHWEPQK